MGQEPWPGWSDARDEPLQLKQLKELMLVLIERCRTSQGGP